jgi:hypothetical protein
VLLPLSFSLHVCFYLPEGLSCHDCVMIREEPRQFGIATVARPLLWACLGEHPWEDEGYPFHPFKYNVPFWGPPGLYLPREKKICYQPSPLMYRAFMVAISPFIHRVLFELVCFFRWRSLKCLGYRVKETRHLIS